MSISIRKAGGGGGVSSYVGRATSLASLESTYPAASYDEQFALVGTTDATDSDGLYVSIGGAWTKFVNDSDFKTGNSTNLFSYDESAETYSSSDSLVSTDPNATLYVTGVGASAGNVTNGANAIDGVDSTRATCYLNSGVGATLTASKLLKKFLIKIEENSGATSEFITQAKIQGYNGVSWVDIGLSSVSGLDATLNGDGFSIDFTQPTGTVETTTVISTNASSYEAYRLFISGINGSFSGFINAFEGYEVLGADDENIVDAVNKLHQGVSKINPTALTADTLLGDTDGVILLDSSGGVFNMTLPAVATVQTGKRYTFKMIGAGSNAVTLDGNGAETIDGATTNATALATQWDSVTIMSDGTQWLILPL